MKKMDSLNAEFSELSVQLSGINPKLSSYKKIKDRMDEIVKELGGTHRIMQTKQKKTRKGKRYISNFQHVHG
jgi:hypothetical protein